MANYKRKKSKRNVKCTMCTQHRHLGNNRGRKSAKEKAREDSDLKQMDEEKK